MFVYCPHCGHILKQGRDTNCPVCEWELLEVPAKYLSVNKNFFASPDTRSNFITEVIEASPSYDRELASRKENILLEKKKQQQAIIAQKTEEYKTSRPVLRCPVCGSSNLSTISNLGKVVKISLIGVWGAGDLGKKRRCETCGHKF